MLFLADIDECEGNIVGCEHNCVNIDGHYSCTCESEDALATDLHNCLGKLVACGDIQVVGIIHNSYMN